MSKGIHLHIVLRVCRAISRHSPPNKFHHSRNAHSNGLVDKVASMLEAALAGDKEDKVQFDRHS